MVVSKQLFNFNHDDYLTHSNGSFYIQNSSFYISNGIFIFLIAIFILLLIVTLKYLISPSTSQISLRDLEEFAYTLRKCHKLKDQNLSLKNSSRRNSL